MRDKRRLNWTLETAAYGVLTEVGFVVGMMLIGAVIAFLTALIRH